MNSQIFGCAEWLSTIDRRYKGYTYIRYNQRRAPVASNLDNALHIDTEHRPIRDGPAREKPIANYIYVHLICNNDDGSHKFLDTP